MSLALVPIRLDSVFIRFYSRELGKTRRRHPKPPKYDASYRWQVERRSHLSIVTPLWWTISQLKQFSSINERLLVSIDVTIIWFAHAFYQWLDGFMVINYTYYVISQNRFIFYRKYISGHIEIQRSTAAFNGVIRFIDIFNHRWIIYIDIRLIGIPLPRSLDWLEKLLPKYAKRFECSRCDRSERGGPKASHYIWTRCHENSLLQK